MWYMYTMEYYLAIKKEKTMPFAAHRCTRDYQTKWSKSETQRQIPYNITYMWNLKYDTKEPACETETKPRMYRIDWSLPGGGRWDE